MSEGYVANWASKILQCELDRVGLEAASRQQHSDPRQDGEDNDVDSGREGKLVSTTQYRREYIVQKLTYTWCDNPVGLQGHILYDPVEVHKEWGPRENDYIEILGKGRYRIHVPGDNG